VIRWHPAECSEIAAPAIAAMLLEQAIVARPGDPGVRLRIGNLHLDRYDFQAAARAFETALSLEPDFADARIRLARCYNALGRHRDTLDLLSASDAPELERAEALAALGLEEDAERECRAVLSADPNDRLALRRLSKLLRSAGRNPELLDLCGALAARGVTHARLLYVWGTALALAGRDEEARALLMDRTRIAELPLPVPEGFPDIAAFNDALAEEILTIPYRLSHFPEADEANRGSSRVHALLAGRRPELVQMLLSTLQQLAGAWAPPRRGSFDPWIEGRPAAARLDAWGLIQRGDDYEEWHFHPAGWVSGVYYVRVPASVSPEALGPGCIEFGPPTPLRQERPDLVAIWRHAPREGTLLLAPSHYPHRTIPTHADEHRISFAFDVVPHGTP
jgi:tetratricopeptide (TPR) repeat protein